MNANVFMTACALGALVAAGPALAQQNNANSPATSQDTLNTLPLAPETGAAPATGMQSGSGMQNTTQAPAGTTAPSQATTVETTTIEPTEMQDTALEGGFIARQAENHILGSELMDAEVVTLGDESLGAVEDVLIDTQGRIVGVVVGVGGFLGIGEKQVAIPLESLEVVSATAMDGQRTDTMATDTRASNTSAEPMGTTGAAFASMGGEIEHIVVDFTREQLEAAPDFIELDERATAETEMDEEPVEATGSTPAAPGQPVMGEDAEVEQPVRQ